MRSRQSEWLFKTESIQRHLAWLRQKRVLRQDVLLVSRPPTVFTRRLALHFAELEGIPWEILSLTSDTTESDLKTRRDLVRNSVVFTDQAPVRAALQGRMLILEGLEKCERNVLPTLNNLLENREINLDDGRLLVSHSRYQHLLSKTSQSTLESSGILPTHPDFFVCALTYPIPPYHGRPIDPPLRSRFQIRRVEVPPPDELVYQANLDKQVVSSVSALNYRADADPKQFHRVPPSNMHHISHLLEHGHGKGFDSYFCRSYPFLYSTVSFPHKKPISQLVRLGGESKPRKKEVNMGSMFLDARLSASRSDLCDSILEDFEMGRDALLFGTSGSGKTRKFKSSRSCMLTCQSQISPA